jgi:hypothetical protein
MRRVRIPDAVSENRPDTGHETRSRRLDLDGAQSPRSGCRGRVTRPQRIDDAAQGDVVGLGPVLGAEPEPAAALITRTVSCARIAGGCSTRRT